MQKLPLIFSYEFICDRTDEQIGRLASESAETSVDRSRLVEKRIVLQEGLTRLGKLSSTGIANL